MLLPWPTYRKRPARSTTAEPGKSSPVANGEPGNGEGIPVTLSMAKPVTLPLMLPPGTYMKRPEGSMATAPGFVPVALGVPPAGSSGVHA